MNLDLSTLIYTIPAILISFSLHEYAHGYASSKFGDPTPKLEGRLTLNPLKHLDPLGALSLLLCGFGWAKPVHVDTRYYRDPKNDMVWTAFAGPLMNLAQALICLLLAVFLERTLLINGNGINQIVFYLCRLLSITSLIAIGLGVFNLIPIPPLDGSKILYGILPESLYYKLIQQERLLSVLLLVVLLSGVLNGPLMNVRNSIYDLFYQFANLVFGFL